jgi:hypothetical protein
LNRQTEDLPFRIRCQPKVATNENGVRTFTVNLDRDSGYYSLLGAMEDDQVSRVMLSRTGGTDAEPDALEVLEARGTIVART